MKNVLLCLYLTVAMVSVAYQPLPNAVKIVNAGMYKIQIPTADEVLLKCSIRVVKCPTDFACESCWGSDSSYHFLPGTVIGNIHLWVGEDEIFVPLSSYGDLANPTEAYLQQSKGYYRLLIGGPDGALDYTATIDFNKVQVLRRSVHTGEDPKSWEETTYHINMSGSDY